MRPRLLGVQRLGLRALYLGERVRNRVLRPTTLGARVILVREGEVLLVRHSYMPGWYLPGGGVKRGESFEVAARREALEEAGTEIRSMRLHGVYLNVSERKADHICIFVAVEFDERPIVTAEILEARWFPLDALPAATARGTADRIAEYVAGDAPHFGHW